MSNTSQAVMDDQGEVFGARPPGHRTAVGCWAAIGDVLETCALHAQQTPLNRQLVTDGSTCLP
ncbi:hypothetical protein [Streptomyces sp. ADI93-02]|uniref:hypothetical protein n=1 Tax=Streptomyces sp. ADI93-02 TaxID=1522757 RepID=UPI000F557A69|nr:hypothetical protein [Streptomyces sp. ADI93-02]